MTLRLFEKYYVCVKAYFVAILHHFSVIIFNSQFDLLNLQVVILHILSMDRLQRHADLADAQ